jgi:starvation-inducible DNA-binding protein
MTTKSASAAKPAAPAKSNGKPASNGKSPSSKGHSMHPTKNDIAEHVRFSMVELLNAQLVLSIDLALQTKQAHWNVKGPQFMQLHLFFDGLRDIVDEFVDNIAERAVALGGTADGTVQTVAQLSDLPPYSTSIISGKDHLQALVVAFAHFGKNARAAIDTADEAGDADTADLFTGISREVDKQLWFLESHLIG